MEDLKEMSEKAVMIGNKPGMTRLSGVKALEAENKESIVVGVPPNYQKIIAVFPYVEKATGVIFAYGNTIYNPSGQDLSPPIVTHELVHLDQQKAVGGPEAWWDLYLANPQFRFAEELQAHQVEYFWCATHYNRGNRRAMLTMISKRLAGPLYGHMTTLAKAKQLIKGAAV